MPSAFSVPDRSLKFALGGGNLRRLTFASDVKLESADLDERYLSWSPDGRRLAFCSIGAASPGLYLADPDRPGEDRPLWQPDAVLNPGGVRIGTAEIYRQVEKLDEVVESIAVGQDWEDDVRVVLFVVLRDGVELDDALQDRIRRVIRENTTPRHVPAKIVAVPEIPRTKSGKIVEIAVRSVVHGEEVKNTEALANPEALQHFRDIPELDTA